MAFGSIDILTIFLILLIYEHRIVFLFVCVFFIVVITVRPFTSFVKPIPKYYYF